MRIAVFLGPTLALSEARSLLDATYLPPAGQGDIYRAVRDQRPEIIGLIDGYFHQVAAVWHREILFALSEGVHVFGASSMGALRAAELHSFGMRGVGAIFEAYRNGAFPPYPPPFDSDEEVAVEHGPPEADYIAVTDALVDMRAAFAEATKEGLLSEDTRDRLVALSSKMHFQDRTYRAVLDAAATAQINGLDCARLEQWLRSNRVSQKKHDARRMLREVKQFAERSQGPFRPAFLFERALVWERFRETCDRDDATALSDLEERMLDELRLDPTAFAQVADEAGLHAAALASPSSTDASASPYDTRAGLDRVMKRHSLARRAELDTWMRDNAIDAAGMRRLVAREAAIGKLEPASPRTILDHLRAAGMAAQLRARAIDKQRVLDDTPEAQRDPTPLEKAALAAWWFEGERANGGPDDPARQARSLGFSGEDAFLTALWWERLYLRRKGVNN